jgi:hypothetical protein
MWLAGEAPALPEGIDALMPPWAQQLSVLGLLVVIIVAWVKGWVVTRAQADREVAAERRVSDIWEATATKALNINESFVEAFAPVLDQNQVILRAVTEVQSEQRRYREDRERGPRR